MYFESSAQTSYYSEKYKWVHEQFKLYLKRYTENNRIVISLLKTECLGRLSVVQILNVLADFCHFSFLKKIFLWGSLFLNSVMTIQ